MAKTPINKKLKITTWIFNIIEVLSVIFFEYVVYKYVSYKDYLVLSYVPEKYMIAFWIGQGILLFLTILLLVIKRGKKRTIFSLVMSILITIAFVAFSVNCLVYDSQIKTLLSKTDETLDKVVENSKLSTDEYGVYILKENPAESIGEIKKYTFLYNSHIAENEEQAIVTSITTEAGGIIKTEKEEDASKLADKLFEEENVALILNQSTIDLIESAGDDSDDDEKNGAYSDFSDKVKCIYTINVETQLEALNDKGNVTGRCFNVYLSGIDTNGDVTAKSRSDVNIIMSVNPMTHQVLLVSTPRDFYVPLSISNGVKDKLTHAGNYGVECSMATLEMLYGIEIDYYLRVNFTGFEDIIDALGGIDVESEYSFSTHGHSYSEGLNSNLSGIEALWFARERHSFAAGDKQRGRNQMIVIESIIKKCQSSALLKNYDSVMNEISSSFQTNMSKKSIQSLVKMQLSDNPKWKVSQYSVSGFGESNYTYSVPSQRAYVMVPDETTVDTAKKLFEKNLNNKKIKVPEETK